MLRIIRSYLNAMDRIAESLESMQTGDWRCLACGHSAVPETFQANTCPKCAKPLGRHGYAAKCADGEVRRIA